MGEDPGEHLMELAWRLEDLAEYPKSELKNAVTLLHDAGDAFRRARAFLQEEGQESLARWLQDEHEELVEQATRLDKLTDRADHPGDGLTLRAHQQAYSGWAYRLAFVLRRIYEGKFLSPPDAIGRTEAGGDAPIIPRRYPSFDDLRPDDLLSIFADWLKLPHMVKGARAAKDSDKATRLWIELLQAGALVQSAAIENQMSPEPISSRDFGMGLAIDDGVVTEAAWTDVDAELPVALREQARATAESRSHVNAIDTASALQAIYHAKKIAIEQSAGDGQGNAADAPALPAAPAPKGGKIRLQRVIVNGVSYLGWEAENGDVVVPNVTHRLDQPPPIALGASQARGPAMRESARPTPHGSHKVAGPAARTENNETPSANVPKRQDPFPGYEAVRFGDTFASPDPHAYRRLSVPDLRYIAELWDSAHLEILEGVEKNSAKLVDHLMRTMYFAELSSLVRAALEERSISSEAVYRAVGAGLAYATGAGNNESVHKHLAEADGAVERLQAKLVSEAKAAGPASEPPLHYDVGVSDKAEAAVENDHQAAHEGSGPFKQQSLLPDVSRFTRPIRHTLFLASDAELLAKFRPPRGERICEFWAGVRLDEYCSAATDKAARDDQCLAFQRLADQSGKYVLGTPRVRFDEEVPPGLWAEAHRAESSGSFAQYWLLLLHVLGWEESRATRYLCEREWLEGASMEDERYCFRSCISDAVSGTTEVILLAMARQARSVLECRCTTHPEDPKTWRGLFHLSDPRKELAFREDLPAREKVITASVYELVDGLASLAANLCQQFPVTYLTCREDHVTYEDIVADQREKLEETARHVWSHPDLGLQHAEDLRGKFEAIRSTAQRYPAQLDKIRADYRRHSNRALMIYIKGFGADLKPLYEEIEKQGGLDGGTFELELPGVRREPKTIKAIAREMRLAYIDTKHKKQHCQSGFRGEVLAFIELLVAFNNTLVDSCSPVESKGTVESQSVYLWWTWGSVFPQDPAADLDEKFYFYRADSENLAARLCGKFGAEHGDDLRFGYTTGEALDVDEIVLANDSIAKYRRGEVTGDDADFFMIARDWEIHLPADPGSEAMTEEAADGSEDLDPETLKNVGYAWPVVSPPEQDARVSTLTEARARLSWLCQDMIMRLQTDPDEFLHQPRHLGEAGRLAMALGFLSPPIQHTQWNPEGTSIEPDVGEKWPGPAAWDGLAKKVPRRRLVLGYRLHDPVGGMPKDVICHEFQDTPEGEGKLVDARGEQAARDIAAKAIGVLRLWVSYIDGLPAVPAGEDEFCAKAAEGRDGVGPAEERQTRPHASQEGASSSDEEIEDFYSWRGLKGWVETERGFGHCPIKSDRVWREIDGPQLASHLHVLAAKTRDLWRMFNPTQLDGHMAPAEVLGAAEDCMWTWWETYQHLLEAEPWLFRAIGPERDLELLDDIATSLVDIEEAIDELTSVPSLSPGEEYDEHSANVQESLRTISRIAKQLMAIEDLAGGEARPEGESGNKVEASPAELDDRGEQCAVSGRPKPSKRSWTQSDLDAAIREYKAKRAPRYRELVEAVRHGAKGSKKDAGRIFGRNVIARELGVRSPSMVSKSDAWIEIADELQIPLARNRVRGTSRTRSAGKIGHDIAVERRGIAAAEGADPAAAILRAEREETLRIIHQLPAKKAEPILQKYEAGEMTDDQARQLVETLLGDK